MADSKVSALTAVSSVTTSDLICVDQGGTSKKATAAQVIAAVVPAGSSGTIQYNNSGALAGFGSWNGTTLEITSGTLTVDGGISTGNASTLGMLTIDCTQASSSTPAGISYTNLGGSGCTRTDFDGGFTGFQAGSSHRLQVYGYWGIEIRGHTTALSPPGFAGAGTNDPSLTIIGTQTGDPVLLLQGANGQTGPIATLQGVSSTQLEDVGYLDAGFNVSTDATYTGYAAVDTKSHSGREYGLRVDATGSGANASLFSSTAGSYGGGVGVIFLANRTTAPTTTPSGGGVLYCQSGALMWKGSSGTSTTIAPA